MYQHLTWGRRLWTSHRDQMEHEALARYAWPLPLRVAGYITVVGAFASIAVSVGWQPLHLALLAALGAAFLYGFHVISAPQCETSVALRQLIVLAQLVVAFGIMTFTFSVWMDLPLFVLAAELQILYPFRMALVGTVLLWMGAASMILAFAPHNLPGGPVAYALASPAGFAFVTAFTRSAISELVQRQRVTSLLDELNDAHARLQAYTDQVEELAVARERNRMAGEIHDTLGHYLTVINVQIETAQKLRQRDPERSQEALVTAKDLATECLNEVRRSVSALRPAVLESAGLTEAVARLAEEVQVAGGLAIHLECDARGALRADVEVAAYRAVQEALTNARKHAGARNVWVRLDWDERCLRAAICDDGAGAIDGRRDGGSFGLQSMRERIERLGGSLLVDTRPGEGFEVRFEIPHPAGTPSP